MADLLGNPLWQTPADRALCVLIDNLTKDKIMQLMQTHAAIDKLGARKGRSFGIFAAAMVLLVAGCASPAGDSRAMLAANMNSPEADGIVAMGYAVIDAQQGDSPAQRRLMAIRASKIDAYRSLAEQVYGQYLESNSQVNDLSLVGDKLRSRVQGLIYGARLVSITPIGIESYETKLSLSQSVIDELIGEFKTTETRGRRVRVVTRL